MSLSTPNRIATAPSDTGPADAPFERDDREHRLAHLFAHGRLHGHIQEVFEQSPYGSVVGQGGHNPPGRVTQASHLVEHCVRLDEREERGEVAPESNGDGRDLVREPVRVPERYAPLGGPEPNLQRPPRHEVNLRIGGAVFR